MAFVKILKTKSYFKRYQVKFRRRREGKTDYYQRKRLIHQDKDRYNVRKYRFIVRSTNKYIICQLAYATIAGDVVVCQANSKELPRYGITVGLSNYAAAYATGLLLARRHLTKLGLDSRHPGCTDPSNVGNDMNNDDVVDRYRPFKAVLDIGLARSSTGAKVFGAMKGALDGGMNIPHSPSRFVGNKKETKEYSADVHREHIYGMHVANYMKQLQESDEEAFKKHFSKFIKAGITHDKVEQMYKKAHELIRSDPSPAEKKKMPEREKKSLTEKQQRRLARAKIANRVERIKRKKAAFMSHLQAQTV